MATPDLSAPAVTAAKPGPMRQLDAAGVDASTLPALASAAPEGAMFQDGGAAADLDQAPGSAALQFKEPGCFGWSAKRSALACIVGWETPYGQSELRLAFMPPLHPSVPLVRDSSRRTDVDKGPLVPSETSVAPVAQWLQQDQFAPLPAPAFGSVQTADLTQPPLQVRWSHQITEKYTAGSDHAEGFRSDKSRDRVFVRCPGTANGERTLFVSEPEHFESLSFDVTVLPGARFVAVSVRRESWPRKDFSAGLVDTASRCHLYSDATAAP